MELKRGSETVETFPAFRWAFSFFFISFIIIIIFIII